MLYIDVHHTCLMAINIDKRTNYVVDQEIDALQPTKMRWLHGRGDLILSMMQTCTK